MIRTRLSRARRLVIKVGASVLTDAGGRLRVDRIKRLADDMLALVSPAGAGLTRQVVLVSSGAIACGMARLGLTARPTAIAQLQACAAVGQGELMHHYATAFGARGATIAQVLLTQSDLADPIRYRNARQTLLTLMHRHVIPVVNENDTVATEELTFGDNDRLAAVLACAVDAQLLVLLTDVDGLLANGKPLATVAAINASHRTLVRAGTRGTTKGGMASKLAAVDIARTHGIPVVIANGTRPGVLRQILAGHSSGTLFVPSQKRGQAPFKKPLS